MSQEDEWDIVLSDVELIEYLEEPKEESNIKIDEQFKPNLEKKITKDEHVDYKLCPNCNIRCKILDTSIICEKCGLERECCEYMDGYSLSIEQQYTTLNNSYISFNIVGTGSYCFNRSLLKTCSDYTMYRANSNRKELVNIIFQYEGGKPPNNVIMEALRLFDKIVNAGYVYRKIGLLCVIS
jgi:hypothetical protein